MKSIGWILMVAVVAIVAVIVAKRLPVVNKYV